MNALVDFKNLNTTARAITVRMNAFIGLNLNSDEAN
jgi:hypothetical protein